MCLQKSFSKKRTDKSFRVLKDKKGYYGYKIYKDIVFKGYKKFFCPEIMGTLQECCKWIDEKDVRDPKEKRANTILDFYNREYPRGFHVHLRRPRYTYGGTYIIKKVYVRNILCKGVQDCSHIMVCKKIFIT